ncbi:MAG: EamA family transporter, partial [Thaumarchaeota archaeon]|nr:EamA family transporter [Nitrososphaerota archaeon]
LGTFAFLFFVTALSFGPVSIVAPLSTLSPMFSLVFSFIFIRKAESINNATILSTIGVVIGAYLVVTG